MPRIRRALISVSDKRGLPDFARALRSLSIEIISTGGTYASLHEQGIEVRPVSDVTQFPEILDGRVKTLHPRILGGLLALPENERHRQQMAEHGIESIDMVVVNLYPFEQTVASNGVSLEQAAEQIDIGGPSMLRSAAKNFRNKAVVIRPDQYPAIIEELQSRDGHLSEETCFALAREVFHHTAVYDAAIAGYLDRVSGESGSFPPSLVIEGRKEFDIRYGENPHQRAALYGRFGELFHKLHGKELSYNNIVDIAAAARIVEEFDEPTVVIVKHTNPCGVGSAPTLADAYSKAFGTDTKSPFGGIIAVNRSLDREAAERMNEIFTEVIIAPSFPDDVLEFLRRKKDRRIIRQKTGLGGREGLEVRSVPGGYLVQEPDRARREDGFKVVSKRQPTAAETAAMKFGWRVAKHVKSNAIVYAAGDRTLGIGAGQMSRVDSAAIAARKAAEAGLDLKGSAVASDAYFPFADGLLEAARAGSTAVIQPGGSIRDGEVISAADANAIAMVFTAVRHFKH